MSRINGADLGLNKIFGKLMYCGQYGCIEYKHVVQPYFQAHF